MRDDLDKIFSGTHPLARPVSASFSEYLEQSPYVLSLLNQIARGSVEDMRKVADLYGGSEHFVQMTHTAAKKIMRVK